MRGCTFPQAYWVMNAPFYSKESQAIEETTLPVLLPHEVLWHFVQNDQSLLASWATNPGQNIFGQVVDWCRLHEVDVQK